MNLVRPRSILTHVLREDDGTLSGVRLEHWDGRVDARVLRPRPLRFSAPAVELDIIRKVKGG